MESYDLRGGRRVIGHGSVTAQDGEALPLAFRLSAKNQGMLGSAAILGVVLPVGRRPLHSVIGRAGMKHRQASDLGDVEQDE